MTAFVLFGGGLLFFLKESFPYLAFKRFEKHCLCAPGGRCFDCIPGSDIKVARFHLKGDNRWLVLTTVNNFSAQWTVSMTNQKMSISLMAFDLMASQAQLRPVVKIP